VGFSRPLALYLRAREGGNLPFYWRNKLCHRYNYFIYVKLLTTFATLLA